MDPMVQRRRLRVELRQARARHGWTQRQVAEDLGWSPAKLLRIENGQVGISRTDLRALLQHYEVNDADVVARLVQMAEQGRRRNWNAYRGVLNPDFQIYLGYEGSASVFRQFQSHVVPGLLQTPQYSRALQVTNVESTVSEENLELLADLREERKRIFDRVDAPEMHFILDESVVRRPVGADSDSTAITRDQLVRLKDLGAKPNVTIQIVPLRHGFYRGMHK